MKNPSFDWLKLDNAAKIFPGQNSRTWSNVFRFGAQLKHEIDPQLLSAALKKNSRENPKLQCQNQKGTFLVLF